MMCLEKRTFPREGERQWGGRGDLGKGRQTFSSQRKGKEMTRLFASPDGRKKQKETFESLKGVILGRGDARLLGGGPVICSEGEKQRGKRECPPPPLLGGGRKGGINKFLVSGVVNREEEMGGESSAASGKRKKTRKPEEDHLAVELEEKSCQLRNNDGTGRRQGLPGLEKGKGG